MMIASKKQQLILVLAPVVVACLLYVPHLGTAYRGIDKPAYSPVLESANPWATALQLMADLDGTVVPGYYAPLGSIALLVDRWLTRSDESLPRVIVLLNILLHCLNGVLLWFLLSSVGVRSDVALLAELIFLIHPLQASSLFWFAERKTVLAAGLYFLTYGLFIRSRLTGSRWCYVAALGSFVLGLLTKPTVTTLPVCLAITEVLGLTSGTRDSADAGRRFSLRQLSGTVPFFILSLVCGLAAMRSEGAPDFPFPLTSRPLIAASAVWFYLWKALVPINLMFMYPKWDVNASSALWWAPLLGFLIAAAGIFRYRSRISRTALWSGANFLVPLLPAIGSVPFGFFQFSFVADHFMYVSMVGIAPIMALAVKALIARTQGPLRYAAVTGAVLYLAFLVGQSWHQATVWETTRSLWSDNLARTPRNWAAHFGYGTALMDSGLLPEAIRHLTRTTELKPDYADAHYNLARALLLVGDANEAVDHLQRALAVRPHFAEALNNLGEAKLRLGKVDEAVALFRRAIRTNPKLVGGYNNLGNALLAQGKTPEAIEVFRKAIEVAPGKPQPHNNLGAALMREGKLDEAIRCFEKAVALNPTFAKAHANLGFAFMTARRLSDAEIHLSRAVALDPRLAAANRALGAIYLKSGAYDRAVDHFRRALNIRPDWLEARRDLETAIAKARGSAGSE